MIIGAGVGGHGAALHAVDKVGGCYLHFFHVIISRKWKIPGG